MNHDTVLSAELCDLLDEHLRAATGEDPGLFDHAVSRGTRPGVGRLAQAAGISERALWRIYHERPETDVYVADRLLRAAGRRLSDLASYRGCPEPGWAAGLSCDMLHVEDAWPLRT